jgi:hypothetical protein
MAVKTAYLSYQQHTQLWYRNSLIDSDWNTNDRLFLVRFIKKEYRVSYNEPTNPSSPGWFGTIKGEEEDITWFILDLENVIERIMEKYFK